MVILSVGPGLKSYWQTHPISAHAFFSFRASVRSVGQPSRKLQSCLRGAVIHEQKKSDENEVSWLDEPCKHLLLVCARLFMIAKL